MQAIISDVHANIEAFQTVLDDIEQQGATEIICLGDLIGYGPNPKECLDMAVDFDVIIQGNHEQALLVQMDEAAFNVRAKGAVDWTREQLNMLSEDREANARRWNFLGSLEESYSQDRTLYVHGTPRQPTSEYLYPRDIFRPEKLEDIFSMVEWTCFLGHSHVPAVWTEDLDYFTPPEIKYEYVLPTDQKTIINVGSVGQPRDGDVRASYVLLDDGVIRYRRLEYPIDKTVAKIQAISELDPYLAERLMEGR